MGRTYAGILGSLAMVTVIARAVVHGGGVETTLKYACLCLFLFAAIGWIVGLVAEHTIEEAARSRLRAELRAMASNAESGNDGNRAS